jgi:hypothetical protein
VAEPLSFADYAQEVRRTARVIRDDLNDTVAASAKLITEAQFLRKQASEVFARSALRSSDRGESAS